MKNDTRKKIGVFGHYGNQNLGDEAIIQAVIENCRLRYPQAEIICFSVNPEDSAERHQVPAYPIRAAEADWIEFPVYSALAAQGVSQNGGFKAKIKSRLPWLFYLLKLAIWCGQSPLRLLAQLKFARQSRKILNDIDVLLISGSNQFLDNFGGAWGFPYTLLLWTVLAKSAGTKVTFISVGAGPLDSRLGKALVKRAMRFSDYYSFRDVGSFELIKKFYPNVQQRVLPDLAFSLSGDTAGELPVVEGDNSRLVGINPMPVYDARYWPVADSEKYRGYVEKNITFATKLLNAGHRVCFFATQPKDENVITDIMQGLRQQNVRITDEKLFVARSFTVPELMRNIARFDTVVATRFHGVLLSLYSLKPVIAVCYGQKTFDLMADCGLAGFAWDLDDFTVNNLDEGFQEICKTSDAIRAQLQQRKAEYVDQLRLQYDAVLDV